MQHMVSKSLALSTTKMVLSRCHDTAIGAVLASLGHFDFRKHGWPKFTSTVSLELFNSNESFRLLETSHSDIGKSAALDTSIDPPTREPLRAMSNSKRKALRGYYVRVQYNDTPVVLPLCRGPGRHLAGDESFCTLSAFKEATDPVTPVSWKEECLSNLGQRTIPDPIEPPPGVL